MSGNNSDQVTLVNRAGKVVGAMDKYEAHRGEGTLHLACSVFLFRRNPETREIQLLVQQRSPLKIVGQRQWGNTICGNVRPNETPAECAHRRLKEELTITSADLVEITTLLYQTPCNEEYSEHELDHIFASWSEIEALVPNPQEVLTTEWIGWPSADELKTPELRERFLELRDFAPWFRLFIHSDAVRNALFTFLRK
jgi:isopentenyl-diphosphate Delta-isomerase